jgi:membrane protein implicated in regulation of membrane protease activity
MRGTESLYGYVIALELVAIAIFNLTDTHGKGAPAHPNPTLSIVGLAAAVGIVGVIVSTRNRFFVGIYAIVAAFLVSAPKVPNSLQVTHLLAVAIPAVYAVVLTRRQSKDRAAQTNSRRSQTPGRRQTAIERRSQLQARRGQRGRAGAAQPTGPARNRRYTPPKQKRRTR